jgi:DNA (cytosine-5)-methyltransferase 1
MMARSAKKADLYGQFDSVLNAVLSGGTPTAQVNQKLKTYIDLFCGIGGFHIAASNLGLECVFACDIDEEARKAYSHNFGIHPHGDITSISAKNIPDHDLLFAGFPCQPFSIIGSQKGFGDPRGTLFFEIARIIKEKQPKAVVLENVRQLASTNKGKTLQTIKETLEQLGYYVDYRILNALNFGVPQKRERVLIVATRHNIGKFPWPDSIIPMKPLSDILEKSPDPKHFVSGKIKRARQEAHLSKVTPSIWHENKSGNISSHPFSCALRAGASYNYLLVDGERRLTPREMLRLQGFPDTFEIVCNDSQTRKQAGNSVPVPMVQAVLERLLNAY